jgi:phosphatidylserine/phosphatidylglycerophosphate/cardiolipin synthase-like enzyme
MRQEHQRDRAGGRRRRGWLLALAAVVALVLVEAAGSRSAAVAHLPSTAPPGPAARLIVEPDAGMAPIDALLASPRRSLDLTIYELVDPTIEAILAADAARGVRVRVLLDHGLEAQRNTPAYSFLRSRGIDAVWSSDRFFATHEKAFVIDDRTAVIMSLNLAAQYYATSRDVAVVDRDPRDVAAIEAVFAADLSGAAIRAAPADDLVWSPDDSEPDLLALIAAARRSIAVESEELSSTRIVEALVAAARRGVRVSVAMTYDARWASALSAIAAAGGTVRTFTGETPLYIHAKLLVVDAGTPAGRAFVGSENLSDASLQHDRELGIVLVAPGPVDQVAAVVAGDVSAGRPWP